LNYLVVVSATEVIEEIKRLPRDEQRKVVHFVRELTTDDEVSDEFKRIADEVFTTNAELFRKLAQ
jgi:mRNA-degrading endonuclease RelE of RelBE toxin-antitoxin system